MHRTRISVLVIAAVFTLAPAVAEADNVTLTFYSDPAGATLYANASGQMFGYTPVTLKYDLPRGFWKGSQCTNLQPVFVRWASGAEAEAPSLRVCPQNGKKQQFTFKRPTGVPGQETDALFALELHRIAALREDARAARRDAAWAAYFAAARENLRRQRMLTCSSYFIGSTLYTNCK